jgi:hypothetical protein
LGSDFIKIGLDFVGNDIDLDDSLARELLSCKYVRIFDINFSTSNLGF